MGDRQFETGSAVHELLGVIGGLEDHFLHGERALPDDIDVLEAYKWMFSILHVGLQAFVWADPANPRFVDIVGPTTKWGGDNADASYQYVPIDPTRSYRVRGVPGDAAYWSLTVYGGPDDGRYSERIVGSCNDRSALRAPDGTVEIVLSPDDPGPGTSWIRLDPDAVAAITRDYLADPTTGRRMAWSIEPITPPGPWQETDASLARRFRATTTWVREQAQIVPVLLDQPNEVLEPYPVPTQTFGWAAGDAAYAMGSYRLRPDEALVIQARSPDCAFWNLCLWNNLLHTYNSAYDRVTINGEQVQYEADGSWTLVVADRDPGHPNWVRTQGHRHGLLWFRWFLPAETPARPTTRVVTL